MKKTKAKRKLIVESVLAEASKRNNYGVSVARLKTDLAIHMSRTSIINLLRAYSVYTSTKDYTVYNSLFPPWLTGKTVVQPQPEGWAYEGFFPYGQWVCND